MAIIQKCICGRNNGEKRKTCSDPACDRNLLELREQGKIQFYAVVKGKWEPAGNSLDEAKASEGKRRAQIKENRILDIQADGTRLLGHVIEDYLALSDTRISKGKEKVTFKEIERNMRNGLTKTFGQMMAKDLTQQAIVDFILEKGKKNAPATVAKIVTYFRAAVRKAVRARKIPASVEWCFDDIKIGQLIGDINRPHQFVLIPRQYCDVIENAPNLKYRAIYEILIHTAIRKGELNKITFGDIKDGILTVRGEIEKTGTTREVPLNKYALAGFQMLRPKDGKDEDKVLGYSQKFWEMKELLYTCQALDLPFGSNRGGIGYHTFRHSWITNAENEALIHPGITRAIAGHTPEKKDAHLNYVHTKLEHKVRAMNTWTSWFDENAAVPQIVDNPLILRNPKVVNIQDFR